MGQLRMAALAIVSMSVSAAAAASAGAAKSYTIVIDKMAFGAAPGELRVGDTIVWVNRDLFRHTATATDRSFNVDLPPGQSARTVMTRAGSVSFFCAYHPGMKGTLVIAAHPAAHAISRRASR